jgi:hypothetical protein
MTVVRLADYRDAGARAAERIRVSADLQAGGVQTSIGEQVSECGGIAPEKDDVISQAFESCLIYLDVFDELFLDIMHKRTDAGIVGNLACHGLNEVANARTDFIRARDRVHRAMARAVTRAMVASTTDQEGGIT